MAEEMKWHRINIATDALIAAIAGLNDHQREILGRDWQNTMKKEMKKMTPMPKKRPKQ